MSSLRDRPLLTWRRLLRDAILLYICIALLRAFVADIFVVPSGSMRPTLLAGDYVLVNRLAYGLSGAWRWGQPAQGDVILFRHPHTPEVIYVKRVVGLPGDTIVADTPGHLSVNGTKISQTQTDAADTRRAECWPDGLCYRIRTGNDDATAALPPVTVQADHLYVLGDNRTGSLDSRLGWQVPLANVIGRAVLITWSADPALTDIGDVIADMRWGRIGKTAQ